MCSSLISSVVLSVDNVLFVIPIYESSFTVYSIIVLYGTVIVLPIIPLSVTTAISGMVLTHFPFLNNKD